LFVLLARSDPAKSIRLNFPTWISPVMPEFFNENSQVIYNTAWLRDEVAFAPVASYILF